MPISKKITSLTVAVLYVLGLLVAVPVQANAYTSDTKTHVVAKYTRAQKATQTKKALAALAKLPTSTTSAKAYDTMSEYDLLITRYDSALKEVNRAKKMGVNYKSLKNYKRLDIAIGRINTLADIVRKLEGLPEWIDTIGDQVRLDDELTILGAQEMYERLKRTLTPTEMKMFYNSGKLLKAIEYLVHLNNPPVYKVLSQIYPFLNPVTLADEAAVKAARDDYTALSPENKLYIYNINLLVKAEADMKSLKAPK